MKNFKITNTNGIKLKTSNKYIDDDINVSVDSTNLVSENIKEKFCTLSKFISSDGLEVRL